MRVVALSIIGSALAFAAATPGHANLVGNSGFETGDFSDWTISGDLVTIDSTFAVSGAFDASFSASPTDPDPGVLSQPIATDAGSGYTLSFSLLDESGAGTDTFSVGFGGFSTAITGDTAPAWTAESFTVPGGDITGATTNLTFQGANESAGWNLDDVTLTENPVPEPPVGLPLLLGSGLIVLALTRRVRSLR